MQVMTSLVQDFKEFMVIKQLKVALNSNDNNTSLIISSLCSITLASASPLTWSTLVWLKTTKTSIWVPNFDKDSFFVVFCQTSIDHIIVEDHKLILIESDIDGHPSLTTSLIAHYQGCTMQYTNFKQHFQNTI